MTFLDTNGKVKKNDEIISKSISSGSTVMDTCDIKICK